MEKITTMYDALSDVHYDVYKTTAIELKKRLIQDSITPEEEIIRFDSESEYDKNTWDVTYSVERKKNERVRYATLGFESAPFIISLDSTSGKYRLLDGYNRLFGTYEVFNQEVLVKVYTDITAKVWMNVMSFANAWKVKGARYAHNFMDRGFKWSLYEHFGIDLAESPTNSGDNQLSLRFMDAYSSGAYHYFYPDTALATLINNEECINDMAIMKELVLKPLTFRDIRRKVETTVKADEQSFDRDLQSFGIVKEKIVVMLGRIRRAEIQKGLPQKPLSYQIIQELLERDDLQKLFIKVSNMQVYGHAENFIKRELEEEFKEYLMTALGHVYTPPAPKAEPKPIKLSEIKF